jgi:SAM-dependent methyltransferase
MKDFWDERYSATEFVYGKKPNVYLKEKLTKFNPGTILFPAEGEGRNAVFAASLGWKVSAFDTSTEGRKKALRLAKEHKVKIEYHIEELNGIGYKTAQFDAIALIFTHFHPEVWKEYFQHFNSYLKKGGIIIFEGFSKKHIEYQEINPEVGGPKNLGMLFSGQELKDDFANFEFMEFCETEVELDEGLFHKGKGSVIHFVARKKGSTD